MQKWFTIHKSIDVIHNINTLKSKTRMVTSVDDKIQHPFTMRQQINNSPQGGYSRTFLNNSRTWQTYSQRLLQWKAESVSSKIRNRTGTFFLPLLFSVGLEVPAMAIRGEKRKKRNPNWKEVKLPLFADDMILCVKILMRPQRNDQNP